MPFIRQNSKVFGSGFFFKKKVKNRGVYSKLVKVDKTDLLYTVDRRMTHSTILSQVTSALPPLPWHSRTTVFPSGAETTAERGYLKMDGGSDRKRGKKRLLPLYVQGV